jgi:hypothetical protein
MNPYITNNTQAAIAKDNCPTVFIPVAISHFNRNHYLSFSQCRKRFSTMPPAHFTISVNQRNPRQNNLGVFSPPRRLTAANDAKTKAAPVSRHRASSCGSRRISRGCVVA